LVAMVNKVRWNFACGYTTMQQLQYLMEDLMCYTTLPQLQYLIRDLMWWIGKTGRELSLCTSELSDVSKSAPAMKKIIYNYNYMKIIPVQWIMLFSTHYCGSW